MKTRGHFVRSIRAGLLGAIGVVALVACSVAAPSKTQGHPEPFRGTLVHFVGRVEVSTDGRAQYAWSGAGFVARFRGTGVVVRLSDDKNEHQVVVDGKPTNRVVTNASTERYVVVENLPLGEHRLEFYRRTEALFGPTKLLGIEVLQGDLLTADPAPKRRIEIVGDSISCGYGNLGTSPSCHFSADTENHYASYGALLGQTFGAEVSTVAWSGRGIVKNYAGEPGDKMGALYERVLPEEPSTGSEFASNNDAVIVNLGTNDFSTEPDPNEHDFATVYVELLGKIRQNNPNALIVCTIGPMLAGDDLAKAERAIALAVARARSKGDARVVAHSMKTDNQNPGCDYHPGLETHRRIADELASLLKTKLGW